MISSIPEFFLSFEKKKKKKNPFARPSLIVAAEHLWRQNPPLPNPAPTNVPPGLPGFRLTTIFSRRPLHLLPPHFHFTLNHFSSSSCSSHLSQSDLDFLPWLRAKSGAEISSSLSIENSTYGRSLFASKFIQAGDCMLKIPFSAHLTPDILLPEINSLLGNDVGPVSRLAVVVMIEQRKGQDSEWAPYISRLPQAGELHNTIFWSENELKMIRPSSVYQETISQKSGIEKEYLALRPVLDQFPALFKEITYKDFLQAFSIVTSRAWGSSKAVSLIPFADFLNHDGVSESMLLSDEGTQTSEVIAEQDYLPGKQVLVRYGKFPNSTLMLDFGFTLPYNIHDQVQIHLSVSQHDPLQAAKLELLHKLSAPIVTDITCSGSPWNSFAIKEVRSSRGKGKGIPQSLRAFARILCADTFQELKDLEWEAVQTDGRLARSPLQNVSKEIQAHQLLLSQITHLIQEYNGSIKSLKLMKSNCTSEIFTIRKRMAQDLLSGELRALKSASAWLHNYCSTISKEATAIINS